MSEPIKRYKVFNHDWTCRGKQYVCPGKFEEEVKPVVGEVGIHFCRNVIDCFECYAFSPCNHVAEVIAYGDIDGDNNMCCTNRLEIIREVPWTEVLGLVNTGRGCTGMVNTGDWNTAGCFNIANQKIYLFDKPSEWTYTDWLYSEARDLMLLMPTDGLEWIHTADMTAEDRAEHPEAETTGGVLRRADKSGKREKWWKLLDDRQRKVIMSIPNFDKEIFKEITGIDVDDI